ncbi:MAG: hypothetical protein IJD62_01150, partial [Oscillospiraceae bacterium]|nr:hypothetical protein [Oscillospiraceae bacterium]
DWGILFLLPVFAKTPHPSAPQTPSPQGEGCPLGYLFAAGAKPPPYCKLVALRNGQNRSLRCCGKRADNIRPYGKFSDQLSTFN